MARRAMMRGQEHVDPLNRLHRVPLPRTKEAQDQSATKNYEWAKENPRHDPSLHTMSASKQSNNKQRTSLGSLICCCSHFWGGLILWASARYTQGRTGKHRHKGDCECAARDDEPLICSAIGLMNNWCGEINALCNTRHEASSRLFSEEREEARRRRIKHTCSQEPTLRVYGKARTPESYGSR